MKIKLNQRISVVFICLLFQLSGIDGQNLPENLLYLSNYRFTEKIPDNPSKQIVLVSTRYFNEKQDSIINPGVHPNRKIFYFVVCLKNDSTFLTAFKSLEDAIKAFPDKRDFLIFVNGYGKNFSQNLFRGFEIDIRYNLNVIIYDWPTDYQAVRKTYRNSEKVTENLAITINEFDSAHKKYFGTTNATIIFHSMGNHVAKDLTGKKLKTTLNHNIFNNLVLNAAGVTQFHHARWVEKLKLQDEVFITLNKQDKTLRLLRLARLSQQLGLKAKRPLAKNAIYIDFSLIAGENHNYFMGKSAVERENPKVFNFYNAIFHGLKIELKDSTLFKPEKEEKMFFIN